MSNSASSISHRPLRDRSTFDENEQYTLPILIVPGLHNSGADHWQRLWLGSLPRAQVVEQADWDCPILDVWICVLLDAVRRRPGAVLVGHSLGCALISHLAQDEGLEVAGAFLVAPADVDQEGPERRLLQTFAPLPQDRLPFPSVLVASRNDPYMSIARAKTLAAEWGSRFVDLGEAGHINVASGHGAWPQGRRLLLAFIDSLDPDHRLRTPSLAAGASDGEEGRLGPT